VAHRKKVVLHFFNPWRFVSIWIRPNLPTDHIVDDSDDAVTIKNLEKAANFWREEDERRGKGDADDDAGGELLLHGVAPLDERERLRLQIEDVVAFDPREEGEVRERVEGDDERVRAVRQGNEEVPRSAGVERNVSDGRLAEGSGTHH
jgi:hypothetical protein